MKFLGSLSVVLIFYILVLSNSDRGLFSIDNSILCINRMTKFSQLNYCITVYDEGYFSVVSKSLHKSNYIRASRNDSQLGMSYQNEGILEYQDPTYSLRDSFEYIINLSRDLDAAPDRLPNNTVIILIYDEDRHDSRVLMNMVCFLRLYRLKVVLFHLDDLDKNLNFFLIQGSVVMPIPYPKSWLMKFMRAFPAHNSSHDIWTGNFLHPHISHRYYGNTLQLAIIYLTLQLGFNVLHLDLDVVPVLDPLPVMFPCSADVILAQETRSCTLPSLHPLHDWSSTEPNLGVMFVRASPGSSEFLLSWVSIMVTTGNKNAQKSFNTLVGSSDKYRNSRLRSCHYGKDITGFSFCFLNELRHQNGLMAKICASGRSPYDSSTKHLYALGMRKYGVISNTTTKPAKLGPIYLPATIKFSHTPKDQKLKLMRDMNLVILDRHGHCQTWDPAANSLVLRVTMDRVRGSEWACRRVWAQLRAEPRGTVFRRPFDHTGVYFRYINGKLEPIPVNITTNTSNVVDLESYCTLTIPIAMPTDKLFHISEYHTVDSSSPVAFRTARFRAFGNTNSHDPSYRLRYDVMDDLSEVHPEDLLGYMKMQWAEFAKQDSDPNLNSTWDRSLQSAVGVYSRPRPQTAAQLKKTVLMVVYEPGDRFGLYLRNLLCHCTRLGYRLVLVVVDRKLDDFDGEVLSLRPLHDDLVVLHYPYALLWDLLARKSTPLKQSRLWQTVSRGNVPSFKYHFGDVINFIPILLTLQLGFNVLHLDLDVVPVLDPLPVMFPCSADVILAQETRSCTLPSLHSLHDWSRTEPNLGVKVIRSKPATIALFSKWIEVLITQNAVSAECQLAFPRVIRMLPYHVQGGRCDDDKFTTNYTPVPVRVESRENTLRFCFLNELKFTNGYMEQMCKIDALNISIINKNGSILHQLGPGHAGANLTLMPWPITVHFNFINNKIKKMKARGMLLFNIKSLNCTANINP